MEFRVLGSLEVRRRGDLVDIGSRNERKVLAALLVDANAVVSTSRLIGAVWGDDAPDSDLNTLQTYVARLRRRLRTPEQPAPIVTRPPGYAIELSVDQLDALEFCARTGEAQTRLPDDPGDALALLDAALALWRGPAFAEFADDELARAEAVRLEELRQTAVEMRADALLAVGRAAEALSVLEGMVAAHPLRERPHAQLMRAMASAGRQVDALRLYQRFRERLAEDLGLEPSAVLRGVESQILAQAPDLITAEPPAARPATEGNLAPAITTFVGRDNDVATLADLVDRARLMSLVGVGGVGKSRLALRLAETVAAAFPDGTWVVELARLNSADAVPHAVATTLGVVLAPGVDVVEALVASLRHRRMLLVVDNCEHVLHAAAHLVNALARRCPHVTIVATSRERLGVDGEHVWPVLPLPVPPATAELSDVLASPAVALFLDRARAAQAGFVLDDTNTGAVVEICRGLDGLPLALEIAASRLGVLTPQDLAQRLRNRFTLLTSGPRNEDERHRTLRALVDWSYGLLDETERAMFDRLSVFAGGWTLDAAVAVCSPSAVSDADVAALVAGLADKSMVVPPTPSGLPRYGMLETLRLYGVEHLEGRRERGTIGNAHARYFLGLAEEAEVALRGPHERDWVRRLHGELDNLRAAHEWSRGEGGDPDVAIRLSVALHRFATWQTNDEILSWAEALVDLPAMQDHPLFPVVLGCTAIRRLHRGEMDVATHYAERALALCDDGDDLRRALPTEALAGICLLSGRLEEAPEHSIEFTRLWRLAGYDQGEVWGLCNLGVILAKRGDIPAAKALTEQARQVAVPTGNPTMMALIHYSDGESLLEVDPVHALEPIGEALAFARAADNVFMTGNALVSNTSLRGRHGDPALALPLFEEVIEYWRRSGGWTQLWLTLRNLVELISRLGAYEEAAVLYGACAAFNRASRPYGPEADRLQAVVRTLAAELGQGELEAAMQRGKLLDDADSVAFASAVTQRLQRT